jgi:lysophospholipase L1-like esterase
VPSWFDQEVDALERRTRSRHGEENLVLFYGSSSFTLWHDLEAHFPAYNVVNHGFGGSTLADCVEYFDRLVAALRPKALVVYAGDNDLGDGGRPEAVLDRLRRIIRRKRETLGETPMAYVSIKISPARFSIMHAIAYTNAIIARDLADAGSDVRFLDVTRCMVGRGIEPLLGYYTEDPLHMNREGYRLFGKAISDYLAGVEEQAGGLRVRNVHAVPAWMVIPDVVEAADDEPLQRRAAVGGHAR